MVVERENLYDERGLPKKPLRLSKLPFLMRKRAINYMSFGERIRLAVVSEDMEKHVKESRLDTLISWTLNISESSSSVSLERTSLKINEDTYEVAVTDNFPTGDMEGDKIPKREIAKWCDNKKEPTENVIIVLKKLQELLSSASDQTDLYMELNVAEQRIFEILSAPVYKDVQSLHIGNYRLENKTIEKLLEFCEFRSTLSFMRLVFPSDYYHEKALKCKHILYANATWMRVTQLLTLRDMDYVYLGETFLDLGNIALIVDFWATVDYDMFGHLQIELRETALNGGWDQVGALEVVGFDEVSAMFPRKELEKLYLILSKSKNPAKKHQILVVQIAHYTVQIKAKPIIVFKELIDILNLVHLRNEKEISLENYSIQAQIDEWSMDQLEENMRGLKAEKQDLEQRLMNLNVQFDRKQAKLVRDPPAPAVE